MHDIVHGIAHVIAHCIVHYTVPHYIVRYTVPHYTVHYTVSLWLVAAGLSRPVLDSLLKYSINEVKLRHYEQRATDAHRAQTSLRSVVAAAHAAERSWRQALAASKAQRAKNKQGQPSALGARSAEVGRRTPGIKVAHPLALSAESLRSLVSVPVIAKLRSLASVPALTPDEPQWRRAAHTVDVAAASQPSGHETDQHDAHGGGGGGGGGGSGGGGGGGGGRTRAGA